jgi:predicted dehydrogenase
MTEDTYAHSPLEKMFDRADVYGVGFDEERAARKPLRLAIIGAGGVAACKHLPAIARLRALWEPVQIAALCRTAEREGRHLAGLHGCAWYDDAARMLRQEKPDGVVVASPDPLHAEHVVLCIESGLPCLIEKPICRSLADSRRICRLADERGVPLMTVANKRYSPPYRRAKRFVTDGPVSQPALFVAKFNLGYDYVDLFESGTIHIFDLARFFMGDAASVMAFGVNKYHRTRRPYPVDNAVIQLEFTSGSIGTVYSVSSALSLKPWERVEIYGNKTWLAVEDQWELLLYDSETGPAKSWRPVIPNTLLFDEEFGGFLGQMENFLQVIRRVEPPLVTGWDGHFALEICDAAHRSLQSGQRQVLQR